MRNANHGRQQAKRRFATGMVAAAMMMIGANANAAGQCVKVAGYFDLHEVAGTACTSPVGVCTAGNFVGGMNGRYMSPFFTVTETAETPKTGVVLFTAETVIERARVGSRTGKLVLSEGGAYSTPDGAFGQLFTVTSGTGGLAGATGTLRGMGTYQAATGGNAIYSGEICFAN